jgi:hypothetical protein
MPIIVKIIPIICLIEYFSSNIKIPTKNKTNTDAILIKSEFKKGVL